MHDDDDGDGNDAAADDDDATDSDDEHQYLWPPVEAGALARRPLDEASAVCLPWLPPPLAWTMRSSGKGKKGKQKTRARTERRTNGDDGSTTGEQRPRQGHNGCSTGE